MHARQHPLTPAIYSIFLLGDASAQGSSAGYLRPRRDCQLTRNPQYSDLVAQRQLRAALHNQPPPLGKEEIAELQAYETALVPVHRELMALVARDQACVKLPQLAEERGSRVFRGWVAPQVGDAGPAVRFRDVPLTLPLPELATVPRPPRTGQPLSLRLGRVDRDSLAIEVSLA